MKKRNRSMFNHLFSLRRAPGNIARPVAVLLCLLAFGMIHALWRDRLPMAPAAVSAQKTNASPDDLWQDGADPASQFPRTERAALPQSYRAVRLNQESLARLLNQVPPAFAGAAEGANVEITLPMPDGSRSRFKIEEAPVLPPGLAARYPEIKTYRGRAVDHPTVTVRFSWTPIGFHAMVFSEQEAVNIEPITQGETANYISYYRHDDPVGRDSFRCQVAQMAPLEISPICALPPITPQVELRTYKVAIVATSEFTKSTAKDGSGNLTTALSAITTILGIINEIYERDLAIHLEPVEDEDRLIFTTPKCRAPSETKCTPDDIGAGKSCDPRRCDPYDNAGENTDQMSWINGPVINFLIGQSSYNIGHVFAWATDGQGGAWAAAACKDEKNAKASAVSRKMNAMYVRWKLQTFAVDLVAHEMGHQLGASHIFNGTTGSCGGNRQELTAYEPGSGSTVMSYAGVCDDGITGGASQNVQTYSSPYFHIKNIEEIRRYTRSDIGACCGEKRTTPNLSPAVNAGPDYTIPKGTPFTLTALKGPADDPNGDAITYCWEEFDLGPASGPGSNPPNAPDSDADGNLRPIFRSFDPKPEPWRTFPKIENVLSKEPKLGESLPTRDRTMTFRVTARDNGAARWGAGGVSFDEMQVRVVAINHVFTYGPFIVTGPETGKVWEAGKSQTVTWEVANTNLAPINCQQVNIRLSTDGGQTFPIVLAANTPNDGAAAVTVPIAPTKTARVKVEAVGNIFFNISDGFEIACAPLYITDEPDDVAACPGQPVAFAVSAAGANPRYQWYKDGRPIDIRSPKFTIGAVTANDVGAYHVVITDDCGASVASRTARLSLTPAPVIVIQPADAALCAGQQATFSVSASGEITRYEWYKNGVFVSAGNTLQVAADPANEGLYHAVAIDKCGRRAESRKARLSLGGAITITRHPANATACAGQPVTFSVEATGGNLKYRWRKNGGNIPGEGAEGSSFTIPAVSAADVAAYSVIVYNGCGTTRESAAASLTLATGCPANNAQFVSQSAPTEMQAGQLYTVVVKMKNTGTTTWTSAGGYKLGSQNPADNRVWGFNRVELPSYIPSAEPNREVTFGIPVYAPLTQGVYNMQWQMTQEGAGWFGSLTPNLSIRVGPPPPDNAWFVSQSAPLTMTANQRYNVSITMKNVGSNTWTTAVGYKLVSRGSVNWGISEVPLPAPVAPGADVTFNFTVTAPASSLAPYRFEWQMMRSGFAFGAVSPSLRITVK